MAGAGHVVPQVPQCIVLTRTSTSHPLVGLPSQSPKPWSHAITVQVPAEHAPVPLAGVHSFIQRPQWVRSLRVSTSQPLAALASQSAKPASHVNPQVPPVQVGLAFAGRGHMRPQPPQFVRSSSVLVSQPLATVPSQSREAPVHSPMRHIPISQRGAAFGVAQTVPQVPQLATLARVSTHPPAQQASPGPQRVESVQPVTHTLPTHRWPVAHCSSVTQSTHVRVVGLQRPPETKPPSPPSATPPSATDPRQASSLRQPRTQVFDVGLQYSAAAHVSSAVVHRTQRPVMTSQTFCPNSLSAHSALLVHTDLASAPPLSPASTALPASAASAMTSAPSKASNAPSLDASLDASLAPPSSAGPPTTELPRQPPPRRAAAHRSAIGPNLP